MTGYRTSRFWTTVASTWFITILLLAPSEVSAQLRDRTPPTAPANLRIVSQTSYTVSLAWDPATDNRGVTAYRLTASGYSGTTATVGAATTSFTFSLLAGYSYSFSVVAVDAAGNRSKASNTVTTLLAADRTPPSAPTLSIAQVTPSTLSLTWTPAVDDGPYVSYQVVVNGTMSVWAGGATSLTLQGLTPSTTYTVAVRGRDNWQNWSPLSDEVTATTAASDPNDVTAPTTPGNLGTHGMVFDCEVWLFWTQSTDDTDPQSVITYEISVGGRIDHAVIGRDRTILYGDSAGSNTFSVVAIDVAGNRSLPAQLTLNLSGCQ